LLKTYNAASTPPQTRIPPIINARSSVGFPLSGVTGLSVGVGVGETSGDVTGCSVGSGDASGSAEGSGDVSDCSEMMG